MTTTITIEQGFSVSVPLLVTDGPIPTVDDTSPMQTGPSSSDPSSVRVVYPDPTAGVANPNRSVRIDALGGSGANLSFRCDNHNGAVLVTVTAPVNRGASSFGEPSAPFVTP